MNVPRILRGAARIASGLAGIGAFAVFASAALQDHTATATAAAGLCLALAVLAALDLESFEGLGIKAKLRTTLSDAEARLNGLDALIRSLARGAFVQAGRGSLTDTERREMVAELTASLTTAGVSPDAIEAFKRPIYGYVAARLWYVASLVRSGYLTERLQALERQERGLMDGPERTDLRAERDRLHGVPVVEHPYNDNFERFRAIAERMAVETPVTAPEHTQLLMAAMSEISDLFEECRRAGNLTDRTMAAIGAVNDLKNPYAAAVVARLR